MSKASEPKIADFRGDDYTKITFCPDLTKFKMDRLDEDIIGLMSRRAYDVSIYDILIVQFLHRIPNKLLLFFQVAASTRGITVFLNGEKLPVKNFKDYVDLYLKDNVDDSGSPYKVVYESPSDRWEVALTLSERGFQQVSFVSLIHIIKFDTFNTIKIFYHNTGKFDSYNQRWSTC